MENMDVVHETVLGVRSDVKPLWSTFTAELHELAASGHASHQMLLNVMNTSYIESKPSSAGRVSNKTWAPLVVSLVAAVAVSLS